jgi:[acyl-carrier-protein] S-malonyltransferase
LVNILQKDFGKNIEDLCSFVAGHSLGEYSALCASGAISLEDTAKLLQIRGNSMANCGTKIQGSMAAILGVEISVAKVIVDEAREDEICQIANDNSVGQVVISGSKSAILRAIKIAKEKGAKRAIELPVSGAFHSSLMADAENKMREALVNTQINSPKIKLIANVTANEVSNPDEIKELLAKQITGTVRWRETMIYLQSKGVNQVIEIGSGKVLAGLVGRTCEGVLSKSIQNKLDLEEFVKSV